MHIYMYISIPFMVENRLENEMEHDMDTGIFIKDIRIVRPSPET